MKRSLCYIIFILLSSNLKAQYSEILNSNRPGNSISAYNVGMAVFQIESGFTGSSRSYDNNTNETSIAWRMVFRYATDAFFEYYADISPNALWIDDGIDKTGNYQVSPISIGATYRLNEAEKMKPAMALRGGLMYYQNSQKKSFGDIEAMFVTQNQIGIRWVFITNWRLKKIIFNTNASYVLSVTNNLSKKWSWFIENIGEFEFKAPKDERYKNHFNAGIAFLANKNLQADIYAGMDTGLDTYFISIGIAWRPGGAKSKYNVPTGAEMVMPPPK